MKKTRKNILTILILMSLIIMYFFTVVYQIETQIEIKNENITSEKFIYKDLQTYLEINNESILIKNVRNNKNYIFLISEYVNKEKLKNIKIYIGKNNLNISLNESFIKNIYHELDLNLNKYDKKNIVKNNNYEIEKMKLSTIDNELWFFFISISLITILIKYFSNLKTSKIYKLIIIVPILIISSIIFSSKDYNYLRLISYQNSLNNKFFELDKNKIISDISFYLTIDKNTNTRIDDINFVEIKNKDIFVTIPEKKEKFEIIKISNNENVKAIVINSDRRNSITLSDQDGTTYFKGKVNIDYEKLISMINLKNIDGQITQFTPNYGFRLIIEFLVLSLWIVFLFIVYPNKIKNNHFLYIGIISTYLTFNLFSELNFNKFISSLININIPFILNYRLIENNSMLSQSVELFLMKFTFLPNLSSLYHLIIFLITFYSFLIIYLKRFDKLFFSPNYLFNFFLIFILILDLFLKNNLMISFLIFILYLEKSKIGFFRFERKYIFSSVILNPLNIIFFIFITKKDKFLNLFKNLIPSLIAVMTLYLITNFNFFYIYNSFIFKNSLILFFYLAITLFVFIFTHKFSFNCIKYISILLFIPFISIDYIILFAFIFLEFQKKKSLFKSFMFNQKVNYSLLR